MAAGTSISDTFMGFLFLQYSWISRMHSFERISLVSLHYITFGNFAGPGEVFHYSLTAECRHFHGFSLSSIFSTILPLASVQCGEFLLFIGCRHFRGTFFKSLVSTGTENYLTSGKCGQFYFWHQYLTHPWSFPFLDILEFNANSTMCS